MQRRQRQLLVQHTAQPAILDGRQEGAAQLLRHLRGHCLFEVCRQGARGNAGKLVAWHIYQTPHLQQGAPTLSYLYILMVCLLMMVNIGGHPRVLQS